MSEQKVTLEVPIVRLMTLMGQQVHWNVVGPMMAQRNPQLFMDVLAENPLHEQFHEIYEKRGKISAIKAYREVTREGLKEAKEKIEEWAEKYKWDQPKSTPF